MGRNEIAHQIAKVAAQKLEHHQIVNLGIGIPTLVTEYIPPDKKIYFQTENGMLGVGPEPNEDTLDLNLVNAGKLPITEEIGASYFSSADSFGMIRGGHVDVAVLGVLQVDERGRIANWAIPGKTILGVGGAMDLTVGAKQIIVTTTHTTKNGESKIVQNCHYPITSLRSVNWIITEHAIFSVDEEGLVLEEVLSDLTLQQLKDITEANYRIHKRLLKGEDAIE